MAEKQTTKASFIMRNHFVSYISDCDMWGVFSAFDLPIKPISEWYTEEAAINAAKIEEAVWESKFTFPN